MQEPCQTAKLGAMRLTLPQGRRTLFPQGCRAFNPVQPCRLSWSPVVDPSTARDRWALRPIPPEPRSIVELIRTGTLDAELAATLWLLVEGRVPIIVAGEAQGAGKSTLLGALLHFRPGGVRLVELAGQDEDFAWLPQASELGWPGVARAVEGAAPVRPHDTVLLVNELSDDLPAYTWGLAARVAVRAASIGYGLAATINGDALDDVFEALRLPPVGLVDDELSHLGVVLVIRRVDRERRRVVVAHYVRPIVRDGHGHLQRLGPAVLATWDPTEDAFEHFGWGVTPELALRVGRRAGDFEIESERRRAHLERLVQAGITGPGEVRRAISGYRPAT